MPAAMRSSARWRKTGAGSVSPRVQTAVPATAIVPLSSQTLASSGLSPLVRAVMRRTASFTVPARTWARAAIAASSRTIALSRMDGSPTYRVQ